MNNLYIVEFSKIDYHSIVKIIIENKTKIKRTLISDEEVELVIYCDDNFVNILKSKDVEINPYRVKNSKL